ncbi:pyridoxal phosphate-dependent transferase [Gongronella butleri]|nr:pyridoxal phosphate-dependent transferase [Gongronella butleri]
MYTAKTNIEDSAQQITSKLTGAYEFILSIPGSQAAVSYISTSYNNDPLRLALELFLVFFALRYLFHSKYKPHDSTVKLTQQEISELIDEWQPEALVPKLSAFERMNLEKTPEIVGGQSVRVRISGYAKPLLNLACSNHLNLLASRHICDKAIDTLRRYGVGSCGPPGFYGTLDVHMDLEREIANFLGSEEAIIYAQNFSTISSVIPAFSKRGDLLVVDDAISFAGQKGVQISRSNVRWFKHNDMNDLERLLEDIHQEDLRHNKRLTRRFIVTEGISAYEGDVAPLDQIVALKKRYKYRLIVDESLSIGVLGPRGAGVTDFFKIPASDVDMIIGSLANVLCASGGFCAGSREIVDHQRLSGSAYCFSASLPAMLAVSALEAFEVLRQQPGLLEELDERNKVFRHVLSQKPLSSMVQLVAKDSPAPFFHLRLVSDWIAARLRPGEDELAREDEERLLQSIVDECAHQGILVTRARYVYDQERHCPRPSIRISVTVGLTKKESEKAALAIRTAFIKMLSKWRR